MTSLATTRPTARARWGWLFSDSWEMSRRSTLHVIRMPFMIVFTAMQPIIFALLFRYVFSGSIDSASIPGDYVDFLMPGVFVMAIAFGAMSTASGLASDLATSAIDRFRSLPMARSAVLIGHTSADLMRSAVILALMTALGLLMGFRPPAGLVGYLAGIGLLLAFAYALIWVLALVGVAATDVQTAQGAVFQLLFPLTIASSAFVPTDAMPHWLQVFAEHQPVTAVVDATRALMLGEATTDLALTAGAWIAGILIVFPPLAIARYRQRAD